MALYSDWHFLENPNKKKYLQKDASKNFLKKLYLIKKIII